MLSAPNAPLATITSREATMAANELIFFPFWAQLLLRLVFSALPPPKPVAESPPR
jgi:hypothetical protein